MTPDQLDRMATSLRAGDYNLLLGAAASLGSHNADNFALPLADEFRLDLCRVVGAKTSHPLQRVYQALDQAQVDEHVTKRFSGCKAGPALLGLTSFIWKRIFTLNIDDALQSAYTTADPYQNLLIRNFRDPYEENRDGSKVAVVNLHGYSQRPEDGYVFSREAYLKMIKTINPWMVVLSQLMASEPFIIMGSSLDETDLDYFLSHRTQSSSRADRGPSILIEPFDDPITDLECERLDLVKFKGTAEQFIEFLQREVVNRPRPQDLISVEEKSLFIEEVGASDLSLFYSDFERVPAASEVNTHDARFFYGHSPTWSDLSLQYDVPRPITTTVTRAIERCFNGSSNSNIVFLSDLTGCGKTTSLRRVGFDFARQGVTVFSCFASSRLEPRFTSAMLNKIAGRCIVLVDNFADQVYSIEAIMSLITKTDIVFVSAERSYRYRFIQEVLGETSTRSIRMEGISDIEADKLVGNYIEAGIVGDDQFVRNRESAVRQLIGEPMAIACCRVLNNLKPLDRIIDSIIEASTRFDKRRYAIAALAQFCTQSGLKYDLLVASGGPAGVNKQFNAIHPMPLAYSTEPSRNYVVPLNGTLAKRVLELISTRSPSEMLEIFVSLGKVVAPRVNRRTIVARTPEARLAARLFDFDQVVSALLGDLALDFYEEVEEEWRWNSRYWEQVALLNLAKYRADPSTDAGRDSLALAVSHSRHAVAIERHPLTLTTLAKIQLVEATQLDVIDEATFSEAIGHLKEAIRIESRRSRVSIQPYMVMFGAALNASHNLRLPDTILGEIREHALVAKRAFARDMEMKKTLANLAARYPERA